MKYYYRLKIYLIGGSDPVATISCNNPSDFGNEIEKFVNDYNIEPSDIYYAIMGKVFVK